jgi:hypothetical protein
LDYNVLKYFKEMPFAYLTFSYAGGLLSGHIFPLPLSAFIFLLIILAILWTIRTHEGFLVVILISFWGIGWCIKSNLDVSALSKLDTTALSPVHPNL